LQLHEYNQYDQNEWDQTHPSQQQISFYKFKLGYASLTSLAVKCLMPKFF
jgi:hypothetical protein